LFFDELPWLVTKKSGFVEALSYLWNRYLAADTRIILIVCGSAASWMISNIIDSRGGLYNRITRRISLQPFNLRETEQYLKGKKVNLSDEYSAFYLKWHREIKNSRLPVNPNHWMMLHSSPQFKTWAGYSFENVCLNHIHQIAKALGFSGIIYSFSSWTYRPKNKNDKGAQIDLLIERSDNCINLCEIKFYNQLFTVTKEYSEKLTYKKEKFMEITQTRKTVFVTLITSYGAKENSFYLEAVNNQLTLNDLFTPL
jgi:hypothetical protein